MNRFLRWIPIDKRLSRRRLALRAEEDVITSNAFPADFCSATGAGLVFFVADFHMVANLDMNRLTCSIHLFDSPFHDRKNGLMKPLDLLLRQLANERLGMDLRIKQNFIGVCIADGTENGVVVKEHSNLFASVSSRQFNKCRKRET